MKRAPYLCRPAPGRAAAIDWFRPGLPAELREAASGRAPPNGGRVARPGPRAWARGLAVTVGVDAGAIGMGR
jgi:hypothetical protein